MLILILALAAFLRIWKLDSVPVSLFGDELDIGYHAYSLSKTGKDYLGNLLPVNINSLADIKPAFYSYLTVPTVAIFGISPYGVRLPAAFLGILGVLFFYLLINQLTKNTSLALLSTFLLAISPWHIQYSRWGVEVGSMIAFYLIGVYYFFKSLSNSKWLVLSTIFLGLTVWTYHAAKVFLPISILVMAFIWWGKISKMPKVILFWSGLGLLVIVFPMFFSSWFGGVNRFGSTSIFNDPEIIPKVGFARLEDNEMGQPPLMSRLFHNQFLSWANILITNYLQSLSADFLFIKGDSNPRHNVSGGGEFYQFQLPFLITGLIFLFLKLLDQKIRTFLLVWLLSAPLPSILTKDGGYHASRLIFLLPILIFLIGLGIYHSWENLKGKYRQFFALFITSVTLISFIFYQHNYWVHYPQISEKWWHAGFKEAIHSAVLEGEKYDKVIVSQADEPALIFFLGWSQYPPDQFQKKYPLVKVDVPGFGSISKLDNFYFPPIGQEVNLYQLGTILPPNTLYLATIKEIKLDLIHKPERVPKDVKLIKSITYPSGDPAFYLFEKAI